jgi:hypothetical protein
MSLSLMLTTEYSFQIPGKVSAVTVLYIGTKYMWKQACLYIHCSNKRRNIYKCCYYCLSPSLKYHIWAYEVVWQKKCFHYCKNEILMTILINWLITFKNFTVHEKYLRVLISYLLLFPVVDFILSSIHL